MSLYGLHNVNLDRDLWSVTLGFDFLFTPNNTPLRDNICSLVLGDPLLPICEQVGVAVMYWTGKPRGFVLSSKTEKSFRDQCLKNNVG